VRHSWRTTAARNRHATAVGSAARHPYLRVSVSGSAVALQTADRLPVDPAAGTPRPSRPGSL